jgi:hypothetical protein
MNLSAALGSGAEFSRLADGIVDHGYLKHRHEFGGGKPLTRQQFRHVVAGTLGRPNEAFAIKQANGTNYMLVNRQLGTVAYINSTDPTKSTVFRPRGSLDAFVTQKLNNGRTGPVKKIAPPAPRVNLGKAPAKPATSAAKPTPDGVRATPPTARAAKISAPTDRMPRPKVVPGGPRPPSPGKAVSASPAKPPAAPRPGGPGSPPATRSTGAARPAPPPRPSPAPKPAQAQPPRPPMPGPRR